MNKIISIIILISPLLYGCTNEPDVVDNDVVTPLVVEGWIEDEGKPMVIVTRAADLRQGNGSIEELVQRWCRVTVSDGEESELLAMRVDDRYFPSVIYTSSRLRGKVGHTYQLTIETDLDTVTAFTTIPPVAKIDSMIVKPVEGNKEHFSVSTFADVNADKNRYYKLFTSVNSETRYYSSFLGLFSADEYDPKRGWDTAKGIHNTVGGHFSPNYNVGDTVRIKLCTLDEAAYSFWKDYETSVSLQSNVFFITTSDCKGNIEGGFGFWAGYGTSYGTVIIGGACR